VTESYSGIHCMYIFIFNNNNIILIFILYCNFRNINESKNENILINHIPNTDRQFALCLSLELGLQKKSLSQILQCVLMFFELGLHCDK